jgi:hypothetical protein
VDDLYAFAVNVATDCPRPSRAARLRQIMLLAIGVYSCSNGTLWAQTSDSRTDDANKSWSVTTDSQSDNVNPRRTLESHTQSGNRTLDQQSVQRRGSDGHFEPYQDIERKRCKWTLPPCEPPRILKTVGVVVCCPSEPTLSVIERPIVTARGSEHGLCSL